MNFILTVFAEVLDMPHRDAQNEGSRSAFFLWFGFSAVTLPCWPLHVHATGVGATWALRKETAPTEFLPKYSRSTLIGEYLDEHGLSFRMSFHRGACGALRTDCPRDRSVKWRHTWTSGRKEVTGLQASPSTRKTRRWNRSMCRCTLEPVTTPTTLVRPL